MTIQPASPLTSLNQTASPVSAPAAQPSALDDSRYDKRDLNQDGYVSFLEKLIYELEHPAESTAGQSYNTRGELNKASAARLIDTFI